jgi:hypothetical protein
MCNIFFAAREKIVEANYVVPFVDQPLAEMGADKSGTTGDKNSFHLFSLQAKK